ncbi:MAG: hypothetical protein KatS3mg022_1995 [Armatimonadota bacterium]|nr:MAG: hypothetical protein KatS3mg022_1995 [Armatimonadota bacterium]
MRLLVALLVTIVLLPAVFAHEEDEHGHRHHHEPHHWESAEMRHEIITQLEGMVVLGIAAGGYRLIRRRGHA